MYILLKPNPEGGSIWARNIIIESLETQVELFFDSVRQKARKLLWLTGEIHQKGPEHI